MEKVWKKKIFSVLLRSGWIVKRSREHYICINPIKIFKNLLGFKVPELIKKAKKEYVFTGLSAIEIWSDYSYVQRGIEKSPYFIKILKKDLIYWRNFFNKNKIPNYINSGSTIGEYVILIPVKEIDIVEKDNLKLENLDKTMKIAKKNNLNSYAYNYMRNKYGTTTKRK